MPKRSRRKSSRVRKPAGRLVDSAPADEGTVDEGAAVEGAGKPASGSGPSKSDQFNLGGTVEPSTACPGWYVPAILAVAGLGLLIRCWHVWQTAAVPTVQQALGDSRGYLDWAQRLAAGDWYGSETFYQAPLYPYMLGVLIALGGPSLTWIRIVQAILGAIGTALLGGAARRFFDPKTGVIAATMMALYAPAIYYDGIIQKASLGMFLLSLLMYLLALVAVGSKLSVKSRIAVSLLTGLVLGLLCLTRENALLWTPLVAIWVWMSAKGDSNASRIKLVACFAVGIASVFVPVAARNASLGGEWSPTTFQSGPNFYIGNGLHATGVYEPLVVGHQSPEFERADAQALAESYVGRPLSSREVSKFWFTRALVEIFEQPGQWCWLTARKLLMTVNQYEVPDVESPHVHAFWSTPLWVLMKVWAFGLLFPLAALGVYLDWRHIKQVWILPALTLSMVIAVAAFFILGRYRLPLALLLIPFAAYAVTHLRQTFASRRSIVVSLGIVTGALVVAFLPIHNFRGLTASAYMNTGVAFGQAGDADNSQLWIGRSIELRGETAVGLYNLAGAQLLAGKRQAAFESLQRARRINPAFLEVELKLAGMYERDGDLSRALSHYRAVLQIDPYHRPAAAKCQAIEGRIRTGTMRD